MSVLFWGAVAVAVLYLCAALWIYLGQTRRIFNPHREISATPADRGLAYEDVGLVTADGVRLHGWFVPAAGSRGVLLFCHGNGRNVSDCVDSIAMFHGLGFDTFVFDYRGYGRSEGRPSEHGTYRDAEAAWRHLVEQRRVPAERIVILGRSLGAAIGSWLAARHAPRALVIESTFTALPDIAAELHPLLPARLLARYRFPVRQHLAAVHCPVLIVHGRADEIIPYHHGQALYRAANEPKAFLDIDGRHYDGYLQSGDKYVEGLRRFFDQYVKREE